MKEILIPNLWVVLVLVGLFGYTGMRRGGSKEITALLGFILGIVVAQVMSGPLQTWFERSSRMFLFIVKGGLIEEDPTVVWREVRNANTFFSGADGLPRVEAVLFVICAIAVNIIVEYRLRKKGVDRGDRSMGAIIGVINGYVVAVYLFPRLIPQEPVSFQLETVDVTKLLTAQINLAQLVVLGLFAIFAFGVYASQKK